MWRLAASTRVILRSSSISNNTVAASNRVPPQLLVQMCVNSAKPSLTICHNFSSQGDTQANYQCVHVFVSVKPGTEDKFLAASLANARASSLEPGIARFDVIQQEDDPTKFVLVEVYKNKDAPAAHKGTNHYLDWRKEVEHMMAEPRKAIKYRNLFPSTVGGWDYGNGISLE